MAETSKDAEAAFDAFIAAYVLNKLPKSQQPKAKRSLQEIWRSIAR